MKQCQRIAFLMVLIASYAGLADARGNPGGRSQSVSRAELVIFDQDSFGNPYAVTSDGLGKVMLNLYIDYLLPNGDICVAGAVNSNGFTVFCLNRLIGATARSSGTYCNTDTAVTGPNFTPRTWNMTIADATACDILLGAGTVAPCALRVQTQQIERIIPGTSVDFSFNQNGQNYSIKTDGSTTTVNVNSSTRTVTYGGTARLWQNGTALSSSFSLPFQLQITVH